MSICDSPQLFAAYHVLLRRLMPGHPPYALYSLNLSSLILFLQDKLSLRIYALHIPSLQKVFQCSHLHTFSLLDNLLYSM